MKKLVRAHPFLFTLASLLFVYPITAVIASPDQMLRPLITLMAFLALLSSLLVRLVKEQNWTDILLSVFVLGFYATTLFFYVAGVVTFVAVILFWLISRFRKRKFKVEQVTFLLNIIAVVLVGLSITRAVPLFNQVSWPAYQQELKSLQDNLEVFPVTYDAKPDIYYIVLDGYARADVLDEFYGYDNTEIIDYLSSKGFFVPNNSHSNYPKTALSVTSTLNMDYIPADALGIEDSVFWWLMSPLIDHSQVRGILERAGYQSVSIATDWSITDNPSTDYYLKPYPVHLNDFESYLLEQTPLGVSKPFFNKFAFVPSYNAHAQLVKYDFASISKISENPQPTFTFAHIISPHPPFVLDQNGDSVKVGDKFSFNDANDFAGSNDDYRQGYIAQVEFVNKQLKTMIENILANSETPPIIILQADHGPGMLTDFSSSANTCLKERFSVFAAYYFPDTDKTFVPDDISAVNVFRLVFNRYFGADLPLLENRYYYFKDTIYIFRTEDVSGQIDRACEVQK